MTVVTIRYAGKSYDLQYDFETFKNEIVCQVFIEDTVIKQRLGDMVSLHYSNDRKPAGRVEYYLDKISNEIFQVIRRAVEKELFC